MAQVDLVAVERKNLLFGERPLDLDGQIRLLHLARCCPLGGEEEIARQLHGQGRSALGASMGDDVVPEGAGDAKDVNTPVRREVLVFNRDDGLAQDGREVVVIDDDPAFQREGAERPSFLVVELGGCGWPIALEVINLRQIDRVDQGQAGQGAGNGREREQDGEGEAAGELALVPLGGACRLQSRRPKATPGRRITRRMRGRLWGGGSQNKMPQPEPITRNEAAAPAFDWSVSALTNARECKWAAGNACRPRVIGNSAGAKRLSLSALAGPCPGAHRSWAERRSRPLPLPVPEWERRRWPG